MIDGFEKETHELTEYEYSMVDLIVKSFSKKIGKDLVVTNKEIEIGMSKFGFKINPARIRKIIHYIRVNRLVSNLISTSKGYYITSCPIELKKYINSLQQRINSIEELKNSF